MYAGLGQFWEQVAQRQAYETAVEKRTRGQPLSVMDLMTLEKGPRTVLPPTPDRHEIPPLPSPVPPDRHEILPVPSPETRTRPNGVIPESGERVRPLPEGWSVGQPVGPGVPFTGPQRGPSERETDVTVRFHTQELARLDRQLLEMRKDLRSLEARAKDLEEAIIEVVNILLYFLGV